MAKPLKTFQFKVRGRKWSALVYTKSNYLAMEKKFGYEDTDALTDREAYKILFQVPRLNYVTVRHEMVHAFTTAMHLASASIDGEQMEEIMAEFISTSIEEYLKVTNSLWKRMKKWAEVKKQEHKVAKAKAKKPRETKPDPAPEPKVTEPVPGP